MASELLQLRDIYKFYYTQQLTIEALKGISLTLYKGEVFGLLGVNGAGKTTLSSIIATLHPPTSGSIVMNDKSIYDDVLSYRMMLGFCPQKPNFEKTLTIRENLEFAGRFYLMPLSAINERVDKLLEQFELSKYASSKPEILSGGYKQRLLIARALVHKPKLVILDEPTVGLDPHIRRQLWEIIRELTQEGVTVILTTHYMDEAEALSSRICILDQGRILALDTPDVLKQAYGKQSIEEIFLSLGTNNLVQG